MAFPLYPPAPHPHFQLEDVYFQGPDYKHKGFTMSVKRVATVYQNKLWDQVGFPGSTSDKESTCQCRRCKRHRFYPWFGKILWTEEPGGLQFTEWNTAEQLSTCMCTQDQVLHALCMLLLILTGTPRARCFSPVLIGRQLKLAVVVMFPEEQPEFKARSVFHQTLSLSPTCGNNFCP